jgi:hypothetical protein
VNDVAIAVVRDGMDLTDSQWAILEPLFRPTRRPDGRERPWTDTRAVFNGVLWVLRTGAPWHDLPARYPSYQLSEAFIDASFSAAKKGAPPSVLLAAVRAAKSWRSATAVVFLSPSTWPVLRRMKSLSSTPRSTPASSKRSRRA